jgi:serine/threonine protein kinase
MSYSKLLNEYLIGSELNSLKLDYKSSSKKNNAGNFDEKNKIINDFYQNYILKIVTEYFKVNIQELHLLGSGTSGVVLGFKSTNVKNGIENLINFSTRNKGPFYLDSLPNEIALKFQLLDSETSYFEKRMIREEYIMHYLNNSSSNTNSIIKESIPKFYFGCTIKFNKNIKFRISLMELLNKDNFVTIEHLLRIEYPISDDIYNNIKNVVDALWRLKISHNDLSIRNIMVGLPPDNKNKIKLIDFGLSEELNKEILSPKEYEKLFSKQLDEQRGSNVEKLKDLCKLLKCK